MPPKIPVEMGTAKEIGEAPAPVGLHPPRFSLTVPVFSLRVALFPDTFQPWCLLKKDKAQKEGMLKKPS